MASVMMVNIFLMGWLWPFGGNGDARDDDATIRSLEGEVIELDASPVVPNGAARARLQYKQFLELSSGHPGMRVEAIRRLADLNLEAGEEAQLAGDGSAVPEVFYEDAINLYQELLDSFPDYAETDQVLYQLARAYESIGDDEEALATFDRLVIRFPGSTRIGEAQFRRGEIQFVGKRYFEAEQAYTAVIALGEDAYFYEQSLYKRGWSLFKQGNHEESLESFMTLLERRLAAYDQPVLSPVADPEADREANSGADYEADNEATGREAVSLPAGTSPQDTNDVTVAAVEEGSADMFAGMSRPERELIEDSLRVLSITFSYMDGVASINRYLVRHGAVHFDHLLYSGLGDLYLDKERFTDAAETYAGFVSLHPAHARSPFLQVQAIEAYTLGRFPSLVLDAKRRFVELYGLDGDYWVGRETADHPQVVQYLKDNLNDLASYDHALAQQSGEPEAYQRAAQWYRRYLQYFPDDPDSARRSFLLAEILFESRQFAAASKEYLHAAYYYGDHEFAAEAGYAALLAGREHEKLITDDAERIAWHDESIEHSLKFARTFPDHEQTASLLTSVAEELFADGDLERAIEIAGLVVTMQPPASVDLERVAWTVLAHAQFDLERFEQAEQAYLRLRGFPGIEGEDRAELEQRIAASVYRQAEQQQAQGNIDAAVAHFMRVGQAAPGAAILPNATYDAAALLISNQRWPRAVEVLEQFRDRWPDHKLADEVTQKLAVAQLNAGQPALAAVEFERIAGMAGAGEEMQREAIWQAVELYEKTGNRQEQRRVFEAIVQRYPYPLSESIEARLKLADLAKEAGDVVERSRWLKDIVAADAAAGSARTDRSRYLAARASLELAEPMRDSFVAARLTIPLKDSLKVKRSRMELALAAYGKAVDYGVAEVTTASTFEIAELYNVLSQDLMNSQRPAELTAEEIEQYDILLEEQAFPFEEKAIELYEVNTARSADGVYDQWVRSSYARLAVLMPGRYAKSERGERLVAKMD